MSRIVFYNDENNVVREIVYRRDRCRYNVNGKCYNNSSLRDLGKVCRKNEECEYYMKEREEEIDARG